VALAFVLGALLTLLLVASAINWLKGKRLWATVGLVTGWNWVPAVRLAKPDSWWARRRYDKGKLRAAKARFAEDLPGEVPASVPAAWEFSAEEIAEQDRTTRRAWARAREL
jgi:hypothetical protein